VILPLGRLGERARHARGLGFPELLRAEARDREGLRARTGRDEDWGAASADGVGRGTRTRIGRERTNAAARRRDAPARRSYTRARRRRREPAGLSPRAPLSPCACAPFVPARGGSSANGGRGGTGRRRRHRENRSSLAREEGGHRDATARTSAVSVGFAGAGSTAASPAAAGFFFFDLGLGLMYPPPGLFPGFFASFATIARGGVTLTTQRGRDLRDLRWSAGAESRTRKGAGRH
jgi:hypothetical protein